MSQFKTLGVYLTLAAGLLLTGCSTWSPSIRGNLHTESWNLSSAKSGAAASPATFVQALGTEYTTFATALDKQGDVADADYFARKAIAAEAGTVVPPEDNANWAIPMESPLGVRTQLAQGRTRLMAALDGGARDRVPALAARAQARYDCWVESTEKNYQAAASGTCRSEFLSMMDQIEAKPATAAAPASPLINVYFDFNKSNLTPEAQAIIQQLSAQLKARPGATVTIVGKADLTGSGATNMAVARRRAERVQAELIKDGIAKNRVTAQWVGDKQPPVATAKGVREPRNRVAEITLH